MTDYVPLSSFENLPSPHTPRQTRRDPWYAWGIAAAPLPPLLVLTVVGGTSSLVPALLYVVSLLATAAACVELARRDRVALIERGQERAVSPWLAIVPAPYLLLRAARRVVSPHLGNPLRPLVLNLALGFAALYYLMLFLAGMAGMVNRS